VAFNKMDLPEARELWPKVQDAIQSHEITIFAISAATGDGVWQLMRTIGQQLQTLPTPEPLVADMPVFRLDETPDFTISRVGDIWLVQGERIEQLMARTMWQYHDAVERVQRQMEALGLLEALRSAGVQPGDTVRIGDMDLQWMW